MQTTNSLAPLALSVPLLAGCLLLALGRWLPRPVLDGAALAAALAVTGIDAALFSRTGDGSVVTWAGGWTPHHGVSVGIAVVADRLGTGVALLSGVLVSCGLLYSWRYLQDVHAHYHVLLLLFLCGMTGFALSGDLFNMFVFFELMGAAGYALTAFAIEDKHAVHGGLNFGIVNSLGAYLTLTGIALLYSRTSQLGLAQISRALLGHRADVLVVTAFVLVCTGWLVKAAVVPFHFWTADAEAVAPSPVCMIFSGVMVALGVFGVARIYWVVFARVLPADAVQRALLILGVLTALLGAVMCLAQRNLKRLLAYSTIAHVGLFVTAVGTLDPDGLTGGALYVAGHAGVKGSLFLLAGAVLNRYGSVDECDLWGVRRVRGLLPWLFVVDGLALAGLPPFGTGLGKSVSEDALSAAGYAWGPWLFIAVSAMTGGAVLRATGRIFFALGDPAQRGTASDPEEMSGSSATETAGRLDRLPATMMASILVLMAGGLAVGTLSSVETAIAGGAQRFVASGQYVRQVLDGTAPPPVHVEPAGWTGSGIGLGLASAALAVLVAACGLYASRLPAWVLRSVGRGRPLLHGLHQIHSGHVGDYVAWLAVGVAGLILLIGIPTLTG